MRTVLAFLWRDLINETSYRLSFFLQIMNIFPSVLMFFYLSKLLNKGAEGPMGAYGGEYFPFVLIGIALQNYQSTAMSAFSGSLRESQVSGTLEAVLVSPVGLFTFIFGTTAYSFVMNSLRVLLYLGLGVFIFGVSYNSGRLPLVFLIMLLTVLAFSCIGVFSACFIIIFKKGDPLNWLFGVLSWLLGGVYYPVDILPEWLQFAAEAIPMTHALEALRKTLILGEGDVGRQIFFLGLWALLGLPSGVLCFKIALDRARRGGALGHY